MSRTPDNAVDVRDRIRAEIENPRRPDPMASKFDPAEIYAAQIKASNDAHLKEMGRQHFRQGAPSAVTPWPDDARDDPVSDMAFDPLDFGERDESEYEV